MQKKSRNGHSYCSPSQLSRRELCPGSLNQEMKMILPDKIKEENPAGERGTLLHEYSVDILQGNKLPDQIRFDSEGDRLAVLWCVQKVINIFKQYPKAIPKYEIQVNLDELGIPTEEKGNKVDILIVIPNKGLIVIDFKYGFLWTPPPQQNWQFKTYSWGAWKEFGGKWVKAYKLQPELDEEYRFMETTYSLEQLLQTKHDVNRIVQLAESKSAPLVRDRKAQCQFCTALEKCPLYRGAVLKIPRHMSIKSHLLNIQPKQRKILYEDLKAVQEFAKKSLAIIESAFLDGLIKVPDYERGLGNSKKSWTSDIKAKNAMKKLAVRAGYRATDIIIPEKILSPSQATALFGKSTEVKQTLGSLTRLEDGKPKMKKIKPPAEVPKPKKKAKKKK